MRECVEWSGGGRLRSRCLPASLIQWLCARVIDAKRVTFLQFPLLLSLLSLSPLAFCYTYAHLHIRRDRQRPTVVGTVASHEAEQEQARRGKQAESVCSV